MLLRAQLLVGAALIGAAVVSYATHERVAFGALLSAGVVPIGLSLLMVTGGIKPIRYE